MNYYFLCGAHHWSRHRTLGLPASFFLQFHYLPLIKYTNRHNKIQGEIYSSEKTTEQTCRERSESFGWSQSTGIVTRPMESVL